jgi:hypothetical protein
MFDYLGVVTDSHREQSQRSSGVVKRVEVQKSIINPKKGDILSYNQSIVSFKEQ